MPQSFAANSDIARFSASWSQKNNKLRAELSWHPERAELTPVEYPVFRQSIRALTAWLEQPLLLGTGQQAASSPAKPTTGALENFPILPTGAGQLRLVEEKYPAGDNDALRRRALEQTIQWFPQDAETVFSARIKLELASALLSQLGGTF